MVLDHELGVSESRGSRTRRGSDASRRSREKRGSRESVDSNSSQRRHRRGSRTEQREPLPRVQTGFGALGIGFTMAQGSIRDASSSGALSVVVGMLVLWVVTPIVAAILLAIAGGFASCASPLPNAVRAVDWFTAYFTVTCLYAVLLAVSGMAWYRSTESPESIQTCLSLLAGLVLATGLLGQLAIGIAGAALPDVTITASISQQNPFLRGTARHDRVLLENPCQDVIDVGRGIAYAVIVLSAIVLPTLLCIMYSSIGEEFVLTSPSHNSRKRRASVIDPVTGQEISLKESSRGTESHSRGSGGRSRASNRRSRSSRFLPPPLDAATVSAPGRTRPPRNRRASAAAALDLRSSELANLRKEAAKGRRSRRASIQGAINAKDFEAFRASSASDASGGRSPARPRRSRRASANAAAIRPIVDGALAGGALREY